MKAPSKVQLTFYLLGFGGAVLFTALLIREGAAKVLDAFVTPEWVIAGIVAYHSIPIFLDAAAWWVLFPAPERPSLRQLVWMRWIGESISTLVPSAAVGGDIIRARLAALHGVSLPVAAGTGIVDLPLGVFVRAGFPLWGLGLLFWGGLFRPATGGFWICRASDFASNQFLRLAIAGATRRYFGSHCPVTLWPSPQPSRMLRLDNCFARSRFWRNLDRVVWHGSSSILHQCAPSAEHGFHDPLSRLCRPRWHWRSGRRLRSRWQSARYSRGICFCSFFDYAIAGTRPRYSGPDCLAGY